MSARNSTNDFLFVLLTRWIVTACFVLAACFLLWHSLRFFTWSLAKLMEAWLSNRERLRRYEAEQRRRAIPTIAGARIQLTQPSINIRATTEPATFDARPAYADENVIGATLERVLTTTTTENSNAYKSGKNRSKKKPNGSEKPASSAKQCRIKGMPIFGESSSPYDEQVEKVTQETLTQENWALMMDISDRVGLEGVKGAKACLLSVRKRLNHRDPHVVLLALSLLDCLWNNSGTPLRREISSKEFVSELNYKATSSNRVVGEKTRQLVKKWTENECKKDPSLSLIESLFKELVEGGYTFDVPSDEKKKIVYSNDPNVVNNEEEEAAIARAIALSLNDATALPQQNGSRKLHSSATSNNINGNNHYPSVNELVQHTAAGPQIAGKTVTKPARVLYDFEAVEENELSLSVGDVVTVLDDSDQNWWRGELSGRQGLFPASFVTFDLNANLFGVEKVEDPVSAAAVEQLPPTPPIQINEEVLMKCIQLLEDCDPTGEVPDSPELGFYEHMSVNQAPLIDQRLAQIDKQHNMLAQIDIAIRDVLASYDSTVQQTVQYQVPSATSQPQLQPQQGMASQQPPTGIQTAMNTAASPQLPAQQ